MRRGIALIRALTIVLAASQVWAQAPEQKFDAVELQAEAHRELSNDTLNAVLFAELNETDATKLASALNRTLNEALAAAKEFKAVRVRSGNNQTYPVYDRQQRLTGWRGRAELRLESRDFQAAAALIGKLQAGMRLGQISFSASAELRKAAEDELIAEAIKAFRSRADIARSALGARQYRIRRISIHTGGAFPPPRPMLARAAAASEALPPPQFEGGTSQISVSVNGTIEVE
jgi:predicted secreted protein